MTTTHWQNWSGSVSAQVDSIRQPRTQEELCAIVRECRAAGKKLRVVGSGHSFTPLVATDGVLINLDQDHGVEAIDALKRQVTVRAGTKIKALGELLFEHGLAQENLGDIDSQSIAGAVSTGTHGTGMTLGSISTQIAALTLITADGQALDCSPDQHAEVFNAARVSMGALGIISRVTLQCVPAFKLHYRWERRTFDDVVANYDRYRRENRNFEFFWMPHTDLALVKFMNPTDQAVREKNRFRKFNEMALENGVFWLFSRLARARPGRSAWVSRALAGLMTAGEDVNYSHRIYATPRLVRFQEMEYNIPVEAFPEALKEIRATIARDRHNVHFPVECRFVRADDIPLSPAYQRDAAYLAVHMYRGMPYRAYFDAMEAIFRRYEGRPHWGKMHTRTADELRALYPRWDDFHAARRQVDPDGFWLNDYLRGLFGV
jgi:FAD-linked oxidoreductase